MDLNNLKVNKITKLDSVLKEVFGVNFNFGADGVKLQKVKTFTESKIKSLRDNGIAVNDKQYQKLLLVLEGIKEACELLNYPVVSGNVSFYNGTNKKSIYPTPVIGGVGLIDKLSNPLNLRFKNNKSCNKTKSTNAKCFR